MDFKHLAKGCGEKFRGTYDARTYQLEEMKKRGKLDEVQKHAILRFLQNIPLDKLKALVDFKEESWETLEEYAFDRETYLQIRERGPYEVLYKMQIIL